MDINRIVDVALGFVYAPDEPRSGYTLGSMLKEKSIPFSDATSKVICGKVSSLGYFDFLKTVDRGGEDLYLMPNSTGLDFYSRYKTYSNYLEQTCQQEVRATHLAELAAYGSYWSGVGALIAIPLSILSLALSGLNYWQTSKQDVINAESSRAMKALSTEVRLLSKSMHTHQKNEKTTGSLGSSKSR